MSMNNTKGAKALMAAVTLSVFAGTLPAQASFTRINGLGVSNWNVEDDVNMWLNPSYIAWSRNWAVAELGNGGAAAAVAGVPNTIGITNQWAGLHYDLGFGPIGIYYRRPYGAAGVLRSELIGGTGAYGAGGSLVTAFGGDATLPGGFNPVSGAAGGASILGVSGSPALLDPTILALGTNANNIDLTWGYSMGSNMAIGVLFSWANDSSNPTWTRSNTTAAAGEGTVNNKRASSNMHLGVGATFMDLVPDLLKRLELSVVLGMPSYEITHTEEADLDGTGGSLKSSVNDTVKSKGNALALYARGTTDLSRTTKLLTTFWLGSGDVSNDVVVKHDTDGDGATTDDQDRTATVTDKNSMWRLDTALNSWINDRLLLIMGLGVQNQTVEQGYVFTSNLATYGGDNQNDQLKTETMSIQGFGGLEYKAFDWLVTRVGGQRNLTNSTKTTATDKEFTGATTAQTRESTNVTNLYVDSGVIINVGAGIKVADNLWVDALARQQVLFGGPYWISGVPSSLFSQLTAIYKF